MTSVISEDALKNQQSRIMKAMRAATQPTPGGDFRDIASALTSQNTGGANYFDTMRRLNQDQTKTNIDAEMGIYNQMKEQVVRGNAEAKGVDDAITEVAGSDPKLYTSILQDLHNDPEPINAQNAKSKVMKYAVQRGIAPLSVQSEKAKINKLNADATKEGKGPEDPASIREWNTFQAMTPDQQKKYIHMKRTGGEEALDVGLGKAGAKSYTDSQGKIQEITNLLDNTEVARDKLAKAKMTGPIFGRIGKAASDPTYVDWQGAKNGLTLLAKSIYGMPNANFSDADRDFLDQITGGKFPRKEAAENTINRIELLANKALRNNKQYQRDILERKTYNRESPVEGISDSEKITSKRIKFSDLPR